MLLEIGRSQYEEDTKDSLELALFCWNLVDDKLM